MVETPLIPNAFNIYQINFKFQHFSKWHVYFEKENQMLVME